MRHKLEGRKFGRETDSRRLMLNNLLKSLVEHGRINTTQAKAKEIRRLADRVITYGKKDSIHHRRLAYKILQNRDLVKKVFDELAPKFKNRKGGYTRILKNGFRRGDCAPMAIIEFVKPTSKDTEKEGIKAEDIS
ncbi:MAG: 50S ribosomal protein L17 [Candidatus Cloacimonadota bacterium]|nr:50S ribosomal protein L17 [Candidatus Cloacimonadota bacterium]